MAKDQGQDWRLYVASSAPSADFDSGDAVWDLVGFSTDTGITFSKDLIDSSDKDTAYDTTRVGGRRDAEGSETVYLEAGHGATSEGQELLWTSYNSDDQSIYFLITNGVTGDQAYQGQMYVDELDVTASDNEMVEKDISFSADGNIQRGAHV